VYVLFREKEKTELEVVELGRGSKHGCGGVSM